MKIIKKNIAEIKPYENNPRNNDDAVRYVANSIKEFGWKVPLVIDKDGVIVAGHTRYKAAQQLGIEKIPCVIADDLNEEQVKAFRLADNKTGEMALWDYAKLRDELDGILDINMPDFGFLDSERQDFMDDFFSEPTEPPADADKSDAVILKIECQDYEIAEIIKKCAIENGAKVC